MDLDFTFSLVKTRYGEVRGFSDGNIKYFNGVPYAAPPVGKLRFRRAQRPSAWSGELLCCDYKPIAPQRDFVRGKFEPYESDFYYEKTPKMSEDCLYLNIATAASSPDDKLPVYMWFHGGGLSTGYAYEPEFDPETLANKGIIVVTVAQRLGALGYLALPQLCDENGKCGNYGFSDQLMALEWVYENIAAFGGDPERITVGGQSGGSLKACALASSPAAKGRVRRVIAESGLKWRRNYPTIETAYENGRRYLTEMGIDPDSTLEELQALPMTAFVRPGPGAMEGIHVPGQMVPDDDLIMNNVGEGLFEKYPEGLEMMCGTNLGEAMVPEIHTADEFYAYYREVLGETFDEVDFEKLVPVTDKNAHETLRILATHGLFVPLNIMTSRNLMTDRLFGMEHAGKNPTYTYLFSHRPPWRKKDIGTERDPGKLMSWHSAELWYAFASLREGIPAARPWRKFDFAFAETVSSYWANFIRSGNPNGEGLPVWPESADGSYMELSGKGPVAHEGIADGLDRVVYEYGKKDFWK